MSISIITKEDLQHFKIELLKEIQVLLENNKKEEKRWLKTSELRKLLDVSTGTLQNLRLNGSIPYSKIGGTIFYDYNEVENLLKKFKC